MVEHTLKAYDEELEAITAELSRMGGLAEVEVADSIRAITRRDVALAHGVIGRDARLDEIEVDIERRAIAKRDAKGADMIVVNDVGRSDIGFESPDNEVVILAAGQPAERVSRRPKREVANAIWNAFLATRRRDRDRESAALRESPSA